MDEFPPNSDKSKTPSPEDKKITQVTSEEAIRRKKPLRKRFNDVFIGGDSRDALHYVVFGVLIPAAKDAIAEAGAQGIQRLIFGESKARSRSPRPGGLGYVDYQSRSRPQAPPQRTISRRARSQHDFDEIILQSRSEAEEVIDRMFDLLSKYDSVTVADLYELVGLNGNHADVKYGWTDLRGADMIRVRNGWLLDLPEPEPLG